MKPIKKITETDAIFAHVAESHAASAKDPSVLRLSIDSKAKVKIGNLSRNGKARALEAPKADDHDEHWDAVLVPFGILDVVFSLTSSNGAVFDFLLVLLKTRGQSCLFIFHVADLFGEIATQLFDLVDLAVDVLETNKGNQLVGNRMFGGGGCHSAFTAGLRMWTEGEITGAPG